MAEQRAAYVPAPIRQLYQRLKVEGYPRAELGGIYANKPGYHNARNNLGPGDYSVQRPDDKAGDGWAASALDITLRTPADMTRLTGRLIELTRGRDQRVMCLREFFGTVDGRTVVGLDVRDNRWVYSDDSHLWHVHISIYRKYATDSIALNNVATAILGGGITQPPTSEDELERIMAWYQDKAAWEAALKRMVRDMVLEVVRKEGIPGNAAAAAQRAGNTANVVLEVVRKEGIPGNAAAAAQRSKQILEMLEGER